MLDDHHVDSALRVVQEELVELLPIRCLISHLVRCRCYRLLTARLLHQSSLSHSHVLKFSLLEVPLNERISIIPLTLPVRSRLHIPEVLINIPVSHEFSIIPNATNHLFP